jgi:hypothetical protein
VGRIEAQHFSARSLEALAEAFRDHGGTEGGDVATVETWEARAQTDIGILIHRYLAEHPPAGPSRHHDLYERWASQLQAAGRARLQALGAAQLRAVR